MSIDAVELLAEGELRLVGRMPRASNHTFLAEVVTGDRATPVVYKPRAGETPLWDFPDGTLCLREVAAFRLARALGWPNVPPTVLRDGPHGEGSVQHLVDAVAGEHFFTLRDGREEVMRAIAAFDVVAGNGDRKGGHVLLGRDGDVWVIDHGLCFHEEAVLRTVIWDFAGEDVAPGLLADVGRVAAELRGGPLRRELADLLAPAEIDAAADRADLLLRHARYPAPGPWRSHPWPSI